MAGLTELSGRPAQGVSAAQQFRAVAYLRWHLFLNGFRRKGGAGELVARLIVFPIGLGFIIGPMIAAFFFSFTVAREGELPYLLPIFWAIFALQLLVSVNVSAPGLSFDPESLIRFPVTFTRYLTIRLFLGLLSASTIVGTVALLASALGVTIAIPSLALPAFTAALTLAVCNMLFIRMIFAWIDRWLSTRRAREMLTFVIIALSIGIQYLNVTFNGFGSHHRHADQAAKIAAATRYYHRIEPVLAALPPGQGAAAVVHAGAGAMNLMAANLLELLACAAIFLAVFAWRMQREYRGENLSEVNHSAEPAADRASLARPATFTTVAPALAPAAAKGSPFGLSQQVVASFEKEWIYVRRNPAQFYGLLIPFAMVFLFAARMNTVGHGGWIFPAAVAYSLLASSALAYNALGLDGAGVQFYFLAPVAMRTVFVAKNLFGFLITFMQMAMVYLLLCCTSGAPRPVVVGLTVSWTIFVSLASVTLANIRSITAPKKVDPGKLSRRQGSQLSALISVLVIFAAAGIGGGLAALGHFLGMPWLPIPILLLLDVGAFAMYRAGLSRIDGLVQKNRETLLEELAKASV